MKDLLSFFIAAMAMVSLLCAVYEAMNQRIGSAATLTTIFAIAVFLFYIPQLETFKAVGVEVRLRQTLDRAEEIIERLKKLAEANARVTYLTLAWGNRMGSPSPAEKQKVLDDTDAQLRALNVDEAVRREIAKPLVALIGVDLYNVYNQVMNRFVFWSEQRQTLALNANANRSPDVVASYEKFNAAVNGWRAATAGKGPWRRLQDYDLATELSDITPTSIMDSAQANAAAAFKDQILALYKGCVEKAGYTAEAATFLQVYGGENYLRGADTKVKELFGIGDAGTTTP